MKYYVLYNKLAGHGNNFEQSRKIEEFYSEELTYIDVAEVNYAELLSDVGEEDVIIISGGDGTLNRFVNDTEGLEIRCEVMYYASGTGNDFLHDLGKEKGCAPFSVKEYIKDLPTVTVKGKTYRFLNNVGFGIDGYCCEVGDAQKAKSDKPVNYTSIAINGLLFHYKPTSATVTVDGVEYKYNKVWLAPTMNGRFYGG